MLKKMFLLLLSFSFFSCVSVTRQNVKLFPGGNYDKVWGASLDALADCGFLIQNADKATGIINATKPPDPVKQNYAPDVTVSVKQQSNGVNVEAKYVSLGQIVDYGIGQKEIDGILQSINQNLNYVEKVDFKYDRFRDATDVSTEPRYPMVEMDPTIQLVATFSGKELKEPPPLTVIMFVSITREWRFLDFNDTFLLIGEERISLGKPKRSGEVKEGLVLEILSFTVETGLVKKMSLADMVEVKIGTTEFTLTPREMSTLREFIRATTPGSN